MRDNIHSADVIQAFEAFRAEPRPGEVYNLGGGRENSVSVLEAMARIEALTGRPVKWRYDERNRVGDHICYVSDLRKLQSHYPNWSVTRSLGDILTELVESESRRLAATS